MVRNKILVVVSVFGLLMIFPLLQTSLSSTCSSPLGSGQALAIEDNGYDCAECGYNPVCHLYCFVEHFFECGLNPDCWDEY